MELFNINNLLLEAKEKTHERLLYNVKFGETVLKCLLLVDIRVLMIAAKNKGHVASHSVCIYDKGRIMSYIPSDFYKLILKDIYIVCENNKADSFWSYIDNKKINIKDAYEATNEDIIDIIKTLKTGDKKFDPDGEKPFFVAWIRNRKKHVSSKNIEKTARYFGSEIEGFCKANNISSKWSSEISNKSLDFLYNAKVKKELNVL